MKFILLAVIVAILAVFTIRLVRGARSVPRRKALDRYTKEARLALTPEIEPALTARIVARDRATTIGGMIALIVASIGVFVIPGATESLLSSMLLVLSIGSGMAIGAGIADSRAAFARVPDSPRIARSRTPERDDYLRPSDRWFTPAYLLAAVLAILVTATLVAMSPADVFDGVKVLPLLIPSALLLGIALAMNLFGRVTINRLLERGQPASTLVELAWDDAIRSMTMRSIAVSPGILAFASVFASVTALSNAASGHGPGSLGSTIVTVVPLAILALTAPLLWWSLATSLRTSAPHYLRRLWPETAAQLDAGRRPVSAA